MFDWGLEASRLGSELFLHPWPQGHFPVELSGDEAFRLASSVGPYGQRDWECCPSFPHMNGNSAKAHTKAHINKRQMVAGLEVALKPGLTIILWGATAGPPQVVQGNAM